MKRRYVVDLDALLEKQKTLAQELDAITRTIGFVGQMEEEEAPFPTNGASPQQYVLTTSKRRSFTQGARRVLILHLFTGPATEMELQRALAWPRHKVHSAIHTCMRDSLVCEGKPNIFSLTMKGKLAAEYFQLNPARVRYEPEGRV